MRKIGTFLLAAAIAAGGVLGTSPAYAHGPRLWVLAYYSDMEMTNMIGAYTEYCDEHTDSWGNISIWPQYLNIDDVCP